MILIKFNDQLFSFKGYMANRFILEKNFSKIFEELHNINKILSHGLPEAETRSQPLPVSQWQLCASRRRNKKQGPSCEPADVWARRREE